MKERLVQFKCSGSGWGNTCSNKQVFDMNNPQHTKELHTNFGNVFRCNDCKTLRDDKEQNMNQRALEILLKHIL